MFAHLRDPALPALERLTPDDLDRITGMPGTRLLRARYQPGARAVLHVSFGNGAEGSVWFFAGTKAQGLARKLPDARLDQASGALFERFPQDHRLPQLALFVAKAETLAPGLIGGPMAGPLQLLRYRPGLSATFRVARIDGRIFYVKQTPDEDVKAQAQSITNLRAATARSQLGFARVAGEIPERGLIAYAAAPGRPLDSMLQGAAPSVAAGCMQQVIQGLQTLWSLPLCPVRTLGRTALLARAEQAQQMISLLDPEAGQIANALVAGLRLNVVPVRSLPVHADMKLEHAFLSGPKTTLIDIESLSLGDPDYDLAKLAARLMMTELDGTMTKTAVLAASRVLLAAAGPHYPWFETCARLHCAKFYAQRFDPALGPALRRMLAHG
jgi:hypothetical protein